MTRVCQIVGGHLECCEAMEAALNPDANSDAKGLNALIVSNWKTGTSRFWCVTYRERHRAGGIALNVCPWCEERIDGGMKDADGDDSATAGGGR